jgi:hypothetical protein
LNLTVVILIIALLDFSITFAVFLAVFAILRILLDIVSQSAESLADGFLSGLKTNEPVIEGEVIYDSEEPVETAAIELPARRRSWNV